MHLKLLPANKALVFLFGDDLTTAQIIDRVDLGRFFASRCQAVKAAECCGLKVDEQGTVHQRTTG